MVRFVSMSSDPMPRGEARVQEIGHFENVQF